MDILKITEIADTKIQMMLTMELVIVAMVLLVLKKINEKMEIMKIRMVK